MYPQLFLLFTATAFAEPLCDALRYGTFHSQDRLDCLTALPNFPRDKDVRYFVEQPMRTSKERPWYTAFLEKGSVQLPRIMSYGNCNIGIYTLPHNPAPPATRWFDIQIALLEIIKRCGMGGANTVVGEQGLGVYIWAGDSAFQDVVNQAMGEEFPGGMDLGEKNQPT